MEIVVNNRKIKLDDKDVLVAQKLVNSFMDSVKNNAVAHNKMQMFLTTVVLMHTTSGDFLKNLEPDVMEALSGNRIGKA